MPGHREHQPRAPERDRGRAETVQHLRAEPAWEFRYVSATGNVVIYTLVSRAGGKCLDLDDGSFGNDKRIQVWNCEAGNSNQLWYLN